jgi:nucleoside-diphosphate-sugar epimerase
VSEVAEEVEVVYHLGALLSDPQKLVRVNVEGTENLVKASLATVKRFVFTSSMAVYSPAPVPSLWPLIEESPRQAHGGDALRYYGQSKIDGENLIRRAHQESGLEHVIIRAPAVYGPGATWLRGLLQGLMSKPWQASLPGADAYHMQWVHVDDLAEGIVLASLLSSSKYVFNIAGDELVTPADVLQILKTAGDGAPGSFLPAATATSKYDAGKALKSGSSEGSQRRFKHPERRGRPEDQRPPPRLVSCARDVNPSLTSASLVHSIVVGPMRPRSTTGQLSPLKRACSARDSLRFQD